MEVNQRETETTGKKNCQLNLNTNKYFGVIMNSIAGKINYCAKNADVQEEFIGILKNPDLKSFWENYIRGRLKTGIIGKYLNKCTPEDILGELTLKIFEKELEWNRDVYKDFKKFMYGQIQNIMRGIERKLQNKIEEISIDEADETLLTVMPKQDFNIRGNNSESMFDTERFNETVLVILKHPNDTELLAVYNGYIAKKKRREVMKEYGFSLKDYERIWKRLLYKLRNELPREYRNMLSTSMIMHLLYNFYRNIQQPLL
jgi:hypothetical protein